MSAEINQVLAQRGKRYGEFVDHAAIAQELKAVIQRVPGWSKLDADMREALEMVMHKTARILNGDPNYDDSWLDISGYVTLVVNRLQAAQLEKEDGASAGIPDEIKTHGEPENGLADALACGRIQAFAGIGVK